MNAPAADAARGDVGSAPALFPRRAGAANLVCCVCSGRHHPLTCLVAARVLDQCADPTPDDFAAPPSPVAPVVDLGAHRRRSELDPAATSARRAERHRAAARNRWRA
jgi:hypothetical protein